MGDMLSQAEIDALLNGVSIDDLQKSEPENNSIENTSLTMQEIDALGEIGNISMGTSATTLFTLLGQKVMITTPKVRVLTWEEICNEYSTPYVAVRVEYTMGLVGSNLLILKESDTKIITDLMMGGEGKVSDEELSELHLSAIGEAMNQMVGSSATSMSAMFEKRIDISPPKAMLLKFDKDAPLDGFDKNGTFVKVSFRMEIGDLIDSEIMQLVPVEFAKDLVENLLKLEEIDKDDNLINSNFNKNKQEQSNVNNNEIRQNQQKSEPSDNSYNNTNNFDKSDKNQGNYREETQNNSYDSFGFEQQRQKQQNINVQSVQYPSFDDSRAYAERKNISLIMDVPLQVTVELGRTSKLIKDILEFGSGSVIELDKLAGDPVEILVNGKIIAKGEVVVIDESFGVRITDIIQPSKRI